MRKFLFCLMIAISVLLFSDIAQAKSGKHYSYQGGHYVGGHGSSHKGGHYVNPRTGNHYAHHN